jgi:hypothetical protein
MLPQPSRRGPESNRCAGLCRPLPKPLGHPAGMKQPGFPGLPTSLACDRKAARFSLRSRFAAYPRAMDAPDRCPECGSDELRTTTRKGDIQVVVCGVCDWSSDPRVGRPPADRSKNFTLRRLLAASKRSNERENRS